MPSFLFVSSDDKLLANILNDLASSLSCFLDIKGDLVSIEFLIL